MPIATPAPAATRGAGTVMCWSTSLARPWGWSMQGQNRSQPSPCTALATQGWPSGVVDQTKPPSQGARLATWGAPWYCTRTLTCSPAARGRGRSMVRRPSGLLQAVAGRSVPSAAMASIVKWLSRSSSTRRRGAWAWKVRVTSPRMVLLAGSMRRFRSACSKASASCSGGRSAPDASVRAVSAVWVVAQADSIRQAAKMRVVFMAAGCPGGEGGSGKFNTAIDVVAIDHRAARCDSARSATVNDLAALSCKYAFDFSPWIDARLRLQPGRCLRVCAAAARFRSGPPGRHRQRHRWGDRPPRHAGRPVSPRARWRRLQALVRRAQLRRSGAGHGHHRLRRRIADQGAGDGAVRADPGGRGQAGPGSAAGALPARMRRTGARRHYPAPSAHPQFRLSSGIAGPPGLGRARRRAGAGLRQGRYRPARHFLPLLRHQLYFVGHHRRTGERHAARAVRGQSHFCALANDAHGVLAAAAFWAGKHRAHPRFAGRSRGQGLASRAGPRRSIAGRSARSHRAQDGRRGRFGRGVFHGGRRGPLRAHAAGRRPARWGAGAVGTERAPVDDGAVAAGAGLAGHGHGHRFALRPPARDAVPGGQLRPHGLYGLLPVDRPRLAHYYRVVVEPGLPGRQGEYPAPVWRAGHPGGAGRPRRTRPLTLQNAYFALRQVFMKALRSSPFLPAASALQVFIFSCWVTGAAAAASGLSLRQLFMKALRSSPFLPAASALQVFIFSCWGVIGLAVDTGASAFALRQVFM